MEFAEGLSSTERDEFYELAEGVAETAQALFTAGSVVDTLDSVVTSAVSTVDGCDYAGIFLVEGDTVVTPAHTDPVVTTSGDPAPPGEGPCLDAIAHGGRLRQGPSTDSRWPGFAPAAWAGIRGALALPLASNGIPVRSTCSLLPQRIRGRRPGQSRDPHHPRRRRPLLGRFPRSRWRRAAGSQRRYAPGK